MNEPHRTAEQIVDAVLIADLHQLGQPVSDDDMAESQATNEHVSACADCAAIAETVVMKEHARLVELLMKPSSILRSILDKLVELPFDQAQALISRLVSVTPRSPRDVLEQNAADAAEEMLASLRGGGTFDETTRILYPELSTPSVGPGIDPPNHVVDLHIKAQLDVAQALFTVVDDRLRHLIEMEYYAAVTKFHDAHPEPPTNVRLPNRIDAEVHS